MTSMPTEPPMPKVRPPERVTIREAAARLGLSHDTIRRRIARGELRAHRDGTASNARYLVELPDDAEPTANAGQPPTSTDRPDLLERYVATLEEQLRERTREVSELHVLLERQTRLLSAGSAPEPTEAVRQTANARPGPPRPPVARRSWLRRVRAALGR